MEVLLGTFPGIQPDSLHNRFSNQKNLLAKEITCNFQQADTQSLFYYSNRSHNGWLAIAQVNEIIIGTDG